MGVKKKILDALDRFLLILREKTLQTLEEIEANTSGGYWAGADAVDALNNKLMSRPEWITNESGEITGYKTPGGADTVFPFNNIVTGWADLSVGHLQQTQSTININTGHKKKLDITFYEIYTKSHVSVGSNSYSTNGTYDISDVDEISIVTAFAQHQTGVTAGRCRVTYKLY